MEKAGILWGGYPLFHSCQLFPDLPNVQVEGIEVAEEITLTLHTTSPTASCPSCGTASSRIQSRYTRILRDLPSVGRPIHLISRWHQGCHNGAQRESELRAKGYKGSQRVIYRYLETLEPSGAKSKEIQKKTIVTTHMV